MDFTAKNNRAKARSRPANRRLSKDKLFRLRLSDLCGHTGSYVVGDAHMCAQHAQKYVFKLVVDRGSV